MKCANSKAKVFHSAAHGETDSARRLGQAQKHPQGRRPRSSGDRPWPLLLEFVCGHSLLRPPTRAIPQAASSGPRLSRKDSTWLPETRKSAIHAPFRKSGRQHLGARRRGSLPAGIGVRVLGGELVWSSVTSSFLSNLLKSFLRHTAGVLVLVMLWSISTLTSCLRSMTVPNHGTSPSPFVSLRPPTASLIWWPRLTPTIAMRTIASF